MTDLTALHTKYRPKNLDEVIGHTKIVSTLKGIVEKNKWPSAIAFFGPTSAGKTTLAYALASTCLGVPCEKSQDFSEVNASESKTIDDIRALIQISKLRPTKGHRRFIFVDEAQGLLSNAQAAACFLKPLESPPPSTTWIIGSMDPGKFESTSNGKAILNRCTTFSLSQPSEEDLHLQARRILKGEGATYINKEARAKIVENANWEMRTLANIIQSAISYYEGMDEKPDVLGPDAIEEVIKASTNEDTVTAIRFLTALYLRRFGAAQKEILNVSDSYGFIVKILNMNWYVMNNTILKGERHPKVWGGRNESILHAQIASEKVLGSLPLGGQIEAYSLVQSRLTRLRAQAQAFAIPESMALSEFAYNTIQELKALLTPKD